MKKLIVLWVCVLLCFNVIQTLGQTAEICNNGIDDDNNGFVDCFDGSCRNNPICEGFYIGQDVLCEAKPSQFPTFTMEREWQSEIGSTNHLNRVSIGDLNRDGVPEVISTNISSKKIYILNGKDGTTNKSITVDYDIEREVIIGNLNNDNCAEIFAYGKKDDKWRIYAYDCALNLIWSTSVDPADDQSLPGNPFYISLADFDGDGLVELYYRDEIIDAHTGTRIVKSTLWSHLAGGVVAVDILGDKQLELIAGLRIYDVNLGNRTKDNGSLTLNQKVDRFRIRNDERTTTSVADYNQDGFLDVIASGSDYTGASDPADITKNKNKNTTLFFWDVKNNQVKTFIDKFNDLVTVKDCGSNSTSDHYKNGWKNGTGRVNIADIDGDGKLNAVYVSGKFVYALKDDFTQLWRIVVNEETSGYTGCTMFDFNGDGESEIVYRDEKFVYILNGDGTVNAQQACVSRTNREYPIVADLDGDGSTELCVTCASNDNLSDADFCGNDVGFQSLSVVRTFRSASEPWVPARKLWNQHAYFNVNVNDDLTIPRQQQLHHKIFAQSAPCSNGPTRPLNSFLNQSPFLNSRGCPSYAAPDIAPVANSLVVNAPTCPATNFTISFKFTNLGDVALSGNIPITFYNGNPTQVGAIKLNTVSVNVTNFIIGAVFDVTNAVVEGPGSPFTLYIVLNDGGTTVPTPISLPNTNFIECNYDNNILSAPVTPLPVTIGAEKIRDNKICVNSGASGVNNGAVQAYIPEGATRNTTDYFFYWSNGATAKPLPADKEGSVYSGIPKNTYAVYAIHKTANCSSNVTTVAVDEIESEFSIRIDILSGVTNCNSNLNGSLKVVVLDKNGVEIANPSQHFNFEWFEGTETINGIRHSITQTAEQLKVGTYSVVVTEKLTSCNRIDSEDVPDQSTQPSLTPAGIELTQITCSATSKGAARVTNPTTGHIYNWYNGKNEKPTPDFTGTNYTNLNQGFYTVVMVNTTTNCESDKVTVEITQTVPPVITGITKNSDQISCDASNLLGAATVNVQGNVNDFNFQWFEGPNTAPANAVAGKTTPSVTGLKATTYRVKVTNKVTLCSSTSDISLNGPVPVSLINVTPTAKTTCIPDNSKIEVSTLSAGTPTDYNFFWYIGSSDKPASDFPTNTTNVLAGVLAGKYTVKAQHKITKCVTPSRTVEILNNITFKFNDFVNTLPPTTCRDANGALEVEVVPNVGGYTYRWFRGGAVDASKLLASGPNQIDGSTGSRRINLSQGTYTVEITNLETGCTEDHSKFLGIQDGHTLTGTPSPSRRCELPQNDGSSIFDLSFAALAPAINFYEFVYYKNSEDPGELVAGTAIPNPGVTNFPVNTLEPGFYTFVAIVRGTGISTIDDCRASASIEIKVETQDPVVDAEATALMTTNNTFCKTEVAGNDGSGSIILSVGGDPADYTYSWSNGNATKDNSPLKPGNYTVDVTYNTPVNFGCKTTRTFTILDDAQQITVNKANGDWVFKNIEFCDPIDGKTLKPLGQVKFNVLHVDGSDVIAPFPSYTFDWNKMDVNGIVTTVIDDDPATRGEIIDLQAGNYFVVVSDNVSNCNVTADFTIEDKTINTVTADLARFELPTQCLRPNLGGELEVVAGGTSNAGYEYTWYAGALSTSGQLPSTQLPAQNLTIPEPIDDPSKVVANNLSPGFYSIKIRNKQNNCWAVDNYELPLKVYPVDLSASASPLTVCLVDNLDGKITANTTRHGHTGYTFNWSRIDGATSTAISSSREVQNLFIGAYRVNVVDKDDAACFASATVTIDDLRAYPTVVANPLAPLTICDPTRPDGVAEASVEGQIINHHFNWYTGATPAGASFYTGPQVSGLSNETYSVIALDILTGCSDTTNVSIELNQKAIPVPNIEILSMVTSCVTDNGALTAFVEGNQSNYIFNWYIGAQEKVIADFVGEVYDSLAVGVYGVTATSRITGCKSDVVDEEIIADPVYPDFNFDITPASCAQNDGVAELVLLNEVQIRDIIWTTQAGPVTGPLLTNVPSGTYSVTATSLLGCTTTKNLDILTEIHVFNGVSRSKDGKNDVFYINCIENFPTNHVKIFNRAGTLVYEADGYDNIDVYFDGKSNKGLALMGNNLPDGTYFYIVDKQDGSKPAAGYLEIVN
jgi:large repetitive protein